MKIEVWFDQFCDELARRGCHAASITTDTPNGRVIADLGMEVERRGIFARRLAEVHICCEAVDPVAAAVGVARLNVLLNNQHLAPVRDDTP